LAAQERQIPTQRATEKKELPRKNKRKAAESAEETLRRAEVIAGLPMNCRLLVGGGKFAELGDSGGNDL
jgi:hypothetical protein